MENVLENLISTIENSCNDNKAEITNVKLFAESWRREFKEKIYLLIAETELEEYHSELRLASIKHQLEIWLKEMNFVNVNQTALDELKKSE